MGSRKLLLFIMLFVVIAAALLVVYQNSQYINKAPVHRDNSSLVFSTGLSTPKSYNFEQIQPLPLEVILPLEKVNLGSLLFHDKTLSKNNTISCASCHELSKAGTDKKPVSTGINGATGLLNSPTVFNSGFSFAQFWDGRAATLEEQVSGPVHNPIEMGSDWTEIILKLRAHNDYQNLFSKIYSDGISINNIVDAIVTYERSLITPNARFDRSLRGEKDVLTADELQGYQLFKAYGCISCHQGINIGANMFQRFGVFGGYFNNKAITQSDLGRYNITGLEEDRYVFKVPSLRNIAVTAPYLHDGSVTTLEKVVEIMGRYQLGRQLPEEDIHLLVSFLQTLTGQWQGELLQ